MPSSDDKDDNEAGLQAREVSATHLLDIAALPETRMLKLGPATAPKRLSAAEEERITTDVVPVVAENRPALELDNVSSTFACTRRSARASKEKAPALVVEEGGAPDSCIVMLRISKFVLLS